MPLVLPNGTLFLHTFKTGGTWVRAACRAAIDGDFLDPSGWHLGYRECSDMGIPFERSFTFVREPVAWYWSVWNHFDFPERLLPGREAADTKCSFRAFVDACHEAEPDGWALAKFNEHIGLCTRVGQIENSQTQLALILSASGEQFDRETLRAERRRNVAATWNVIVPANVAALIRKREREVYRRWYRVDRDSSRW